MHKGTIFPHDHGPWARATDLAFFKYCEGEPVRVTSTEREPPAHVVAEYGDAVEVRIALRPAEYEKPFATSFFVPISRLDAFAGMTVAEVRLCALFEMSRAVRFGDIAAFTAAELTKAGRA